MPITARQFADPAVRENLIREKEMKVLQFWSDKHRETPVDVFVIEPFDFPEEYAQAVCDQIETPEGAVVDVRYVAIATLITMKEAVGRERDLDDIQHLRWIQEEQEK